MSTDTLELMEEISAGEPGPTSVDFAPCLGDAFRSAFWGLGNARRMGLLIVSIPLCTGLPGHFHFHVFSLSPCQP